MDADWILIFKMRRGDDAAWEQFVRKYYGDILKYCHFHCRSRETAEDLTQEVFLRFFSALANYQHRGKTKNYLYTIAANLCKTQGARNRELPLEQAAVMDPPSEPDAGLMLETALGRLPEELRAAVILHYYQGLKLREAADVLQIGLPLMKYRLKRARELLRKELEE